MAQLKFSDRFDLEVKSKIISSTLLGFKMALSSHRLLIFTADPQWPLEAHASQLKRVSGVALFQDPCMCDVRIALDLVETFGLY